MLQVSLSTADVNLLIARVDPNWRYEQGCLYGKVKPPVGEVRMVVVPYQQGDYLVLSIPFDQVKGKLTGGLLAQLTKIFWKFIKEQVTKVVDRQLAREGLPPDTVIVERREDRYGHVGVVAISMLRLNQWLERKARLGNFLLALQSFSFDAAGASVRCTLRPAR